MVKGDLFIESKHADVKLVRNQDFLLIWYDTPTKGKALTVEFIPENYPNLSVSIHSNTYAKRSVSKCLNQLGYEESKYKF